MAGGRSPTGCVLCQWIGPADRPVAVTHTDRSGLPGCAALQQRCPYGADPQRQSQRRPGSV